MAKNDGAATQPATGTVKPLSFFEGTQYLDYVALANELLSSIPGYLANEDKPAAESALKRMKETLASLKHGERQEKSDGGSPPPELLDAIATVESYIAQGESEIKSYGS